MRTARAVTIGAVVAISALVGTAAAGLAQDRSLHVHYTHTKETEHVVFKRNGRYVQTGLDRLNHLTRDWRRNEPTKMDPALFDLLWEVYQETGSNQPIHIVSGYRAPATNAMLASNSSGVANNSQHMQGKAMDFFIPGVSASRLREIGFKKQIGGVGFYPSSGNPFVHLDTGSVRAWPRMTTAQLKQIFPDGRTLHLPSNGNVLSNEGRQYAQAEWNRCRRVPCGSGPAAGSGDTRMADGGDRRTLMDLFTGGGRTETAAAPQTAPAQPAAPAGEAQAPASAAPATRTVSVAALDAPPPARPAALGGTPPAPADLPFQLIERETVASGEPDLEAPVPPTMPERVASLRARAAQPDPSAPTETTLSDGAMAIAALDSPPPPRPQSQSGAVSASAYAAAGASLGRLLEAQPQAQDPVTTASLRPSVTEAPPISSSGSATGAVIAASFSPQMGLESFAHLFEGPITPEDVASPETLTADVLDSISTRQGELFAPDLDHITDVFLSPEPVSGEGFAWINDAPDNGDFDPAVQPGTLGNHQFSRTASLGTVETAFGRGDTIWVRFGQ
ncbi:DUF882 domain-containing protein [Pelagibacterium montanilacus]|uniref:DUF882 domain-containing protein n=1 Tax=Pelagibacterium montanilacus TaxID=2185280 RepID=UPI000F8D317D|nr:DUF882 domain-containing protein [Pelagibacterium montanilacus]